MSWFWLLLGAGAAAPLATEYRRRPMDDRARGNAPGHFARLSMGVTHYDWFGPRTGPVVVCVHGLTTPSFVYRGLARGLALMGCRVLVYDLYGRGYSDRPRARQDAKFFHRQLRELLDHVGVGDDITLIGYSMGGAIATSFAAEHPGRIQQLVLLAPAGMRVPAGRMINIIRSSPLLGDWLMHAVYPRQFRKGVEAERDLPSSVPDIGKLQTAELDSRGFIRSVLSSLRGILAADQREAHTRIAQQGLPVLAVWGRDDDVIPLSCVGTLAEWNRSAVQEVIPGAGHGLPYTHTNEVLRILRGELIALSGR